jgi:cytochrome c oxidase subunit 2
MIPARLPARVGMMGAIGAAVAAAACGAQSTFQPGGPAARSLSHLGWFVLITFLITTAVMWILIGWVGYRRRGTLSEHAPVDVDTNGGFSWILIGGIAVPAAVLAVIFVVTLKNMSAFPLHHAEGDPQIRVVGHQWWFEVEYLMGGLPQRVKTSTEIHIPVGHPIDIALETRDVIHSFWVPQLHGKVDLMPGMVNHVRLQADQPGVYRGECAEYCGMQHAHMILYVIAEPEEQFAAWLEGQRQPAAVPASDAAIRGRHQFETRACALCHTVRGTPALGSVGPDLTHVASRGTIAGGMLPNNIANLHAWATHAQSLKPGAQMPDITQFSGEELHQLVEYLRSLR